MGIIVTETHKTRLQQKNQLLTAFYIFLNFPNEFKQSANNLEQLRLGLTTKL